MDVLVYRKRNIILLSFDLKHFVLREMHRMQLYKSIFLVNQACGVSMTAYWRCAKLSMDLWLAVNVGKHCGDVGDASRQDWIVRLGLFIQKRNGGRSGGASSTWRPQSRGSKRAAGDAAWSLIKMCKCSKQKSVDILHLSYLPRSLWYSMFPPHTSQ
jgi:hypothetical protein